MDSLVRETAMCVGRREQMKIVIDISEKQYRWITDCEIIPEAIKEELIDAIRAGKPLQTGRWIYHVSELFPADSTQECSVCHAEERLLYEDKFCPNCGARMERNEELIQRAQEAYDPRYYPKYNYQEELIIAAGTMNSFLQDISRNIAFIADKMEANE